MGCEDSKELAPPMEKPMDISGLRLRSASIGYEATPQPKVDNEEEYGLM